MRHLLLTVNILWSNQIALVSPALCSVTFHAVTPTDCRKTIGKLLHNKQFLFYLNTIFWKPPKCAIRSWNILFNLRFPDVTVIFVVWFIYWISVFSLFFNIERTLLYDDCEFSITFYFLRKPLIILEWKLNK